MMELVLNLTWAMIAVGSSATVLRRSRDRKSVVAVFFILALLFPIISASDDLLSADRALDSGLAAVLAFIAFWIGLVAIAHLSAENLGFARLEPIPNSDPRSPPRR